MIDEEPLGRAVDRSRANAYVVEEFEYGPGGTNDLIASALFEVHLHRGDGEVEYLLGPVPLDEALAWARARAEVVIVRTLEREGIQTQYTAGDRPAVDLGEVRSWPSKGLELTSRRMPGREFVDRADDDPEISWDVHVSGYLMVKADEVAVERFLSEPGSAGSAMRDARVGPKDVPPEGAGDAWTSYTPLDSRPIDAVVRVRARTSQQAELQAIEIIAASPEATSASETPPAFAIEITIADAAPTDSPHAPVLT